MNEILEALRHPWRRAILKLTWERDDGEGVSPTEMAAGLGFTLGDASYHTRRMLHDRILIIAREKPISGSTQHFYSFAADVERVRWVREILGLPIKGG